MKIIRNESIVKCITNKLHSHSERVVSFTFELEAYHIIICKFNTGYFYG